MLNIKPITPTKNITLSLNSPTKLAEASQQYQTAEVSGIVTSISFPQKKGDPTNFRINCPNIGKSFDAVCDLFCPVRQGDTIYAMCVIGQDGKLYLSRSPFAQPPMDRDSIIQCFMRSLKQGFYPAVKIFTTISTMAGGDNEVIPFLTTIAQSWNDTHNSDILFGFAGVDSDDVKRLLNWWHRERNLRRLYLFGLTKKEINACRMTCDEIYHRCMDNPYTVPAIPLDKCDDILDRLNKRPIEANRIRGAIVRVIWKNLNESGWTGTPTHFLTRQFPGIKEHVEALKQDYGMIAEMGTAYLAFPHKVETFMADYIANKCLNDSIKYDTPIDERITLENKRVIERISAHYTKELSADQQKAVQGALDHSLCIITGGAGTGKCLGAGTLVLMADGSIKKIECIEQGEQVMGPDSKPRNVLSVCTGVDDMFEIVPKRGDSFICNAPHILTLKGIRPRIEIIKDKHIVTYSEYGFIKNTFYETKERADSFISTLPEDIFDVPLDKYMSRPTDQQSASYLYHVGVDYTPQDTPMDPYIMGCQLGDDKLFDTLNMVDNKHIPDVYKINSRTVRMEVLAGIIDNSGFMNGHRIFINCKNIKLADDIKYLAFSLGFMVEVIRRVEQYIRGGEDLRHHVKYVVITGGSYDEIPVLKRLKNTDILKDLICARPTCQSFNIYPRGRGKYYGFELDGDGRFMLGDFLVTHNTTCIGQIIHNLELRGINYAICSFTGKAVARIREVTKKRNPATMHRLIANTKKNHLDKRSSQFEKEIPLSKYEHVIIDEVSMVTTELLYDFVRAYPNIQRLTLIGDVNQLPPIGWGSLFAQILKSETVPTYKLTTNYRVYTTDGERDGIILNANAIITHDPLYPFEFVHTNNFSVIEGPIERVYDIIKGCFSGGVRVDQLIIITPYNRALDMLNRTFQDIYNVGARYTTDSRHVKWMIGDRVMLTENDQEIGVYNGETGIIRDITDKAILVDFNQSGCHEFLLEPSHNDRLNYGQGTTSRYSRRGQAVDDARDGDEGDIDDERTVKRLIHAFALTVDKSQGSEADFVIFYIPEFNTGSFLNKNRIYTALTRSKRCCWSVVTDSEAYNISSVKSSSFRCENLAKRLSAKLPNLKPFKIAAPIVQLEMNNDMPIMPEESFGPQDFGFDCDDE